MTHSQPNVPYYLTIEKGLVHFGSEVRKISYTHLIYSCILQSVRNIDTDKPVFHQTGQNIEQVKFREALLRFPVYSTIKNLDAEADALELAFVQQEGLQ